MPRALIVIFAIVSAFPLHLAAAATPVTEDAPITPSVAELAQRLGLDPARDRSRFMMEVVRLLYQSRDTRPPVLTAERAPNPGSSRTAPNRVPVPLTAAVWGRAIFRRTVPPDQLIATILSDRRAALICRGLAGLDDETLAYLAERPSLLLLLYEQAPGVFAAFGENLRIRNGRVVPPGGEQAAPLWEAVVGASLAAPDLFVRLLFVGYEGRIAYLYDAVAAADPRSAAFALGLWISDDTQRVGRFVALLDACARGYHEWRADDHPFTRPLGDLGVLLLRIRLEPSGAPSAPAGRAFWARALDVDPNVSATTLGALVGDATGPIDAAWLVDATAGEDMYARTDRLDQFAFGQRVFSDVDEATSAQAAEALRPFRRYRMLLLTLDRMGVRSPSVYVTAVQRADTVTNAPSNHRFWTLAAFQGTLALLARMRRAGTIGQAAGVALLTSLCAVPLEDGTYEGALAQWIRSDLAGALPRGGTWENRAMSAMAGPIQEENAPHLVWEGQAYRLDLPLAERQRLDIVRGKQAGHTLDLALAIEGIGRTLRSQALSLDLVRTAERDLRALAVESAARLRHPPVNLLPPGVDMPRDPLLWVNGAVEDLGKITKPGDVRRVPRIAVSLQQLSDIVLGNALLSLAYAGDIGDPEGAALLAGNVSLRHDFGLARKDTDSRQRIPWALPRQDFQPGVPWHITGSVLGLDIALAPLNLYRLTIDRMADAPKLSSIEREALSMSVGMMEPLRLNEGDLDAMAAAIARGRDRVRAFRADKLDEVAELLGFDGYRRRAVAWALENAPRSVAEQFSLVDLLTLGGGAPGADVDAWGVPGLYSDGCACLRLPSSRSWRVLEGRPQLPMMAATMGDLNLAVALMLREMKLPAALLRPVLAVGMQDFIDEMTPANSNDWWSLSRKAQNLQRQRLEDYVSVAAAVNGPLVPENPGSSRHD